MEYSDVGIQCPHGHDMKKGSMHGISVFMHDEKNGLASCDTLNMPRSVDEILYETNEYFEATAKFCASFLVSESLRIRSYTYLATIDTAENMFAAMCALNSILRDAFNAERIFAELYGTFGVFEVQSNIREAVGAIRLPDVMPISTGYTYSLYSLRGLKMSVIHQNIRKKYGN